MQYPRIPSSENEYSGLLRVSPAILKYMQSVLHRWDVEEVKVVVSRGTDNYFLFNVQGDIVGASGFSGSGESHFLLSIENVP